MDPIRIDVRTSTGSYPVWIDAGLAARLSPLLQEARLVSRRFVVSSPVVWRLHGPALARAVPGAEVVLVPDGERSKQLSTVSRIYEALIRAEADRASVVIAAGGGVIGDMAGFAAATFLRGVPLVQVPTTLLAQVDSAIGGKVGVNHPLGKNLIGAFYPPALVCIDPTLLETLPRREFRAGLYEVVKYGMIASPDLFARLGRETAAIFRRRPETLMPIIAESCRIKADVVGTDEREAGLRRVLNFGHTAGHALEAATKYRRFRHGEAVAYGMLAAAHLAVARAAMAEADRQALAALIGALGPLPSVADIPVAALLEAMRRDKKIVDGRLHFVLPTGIGRTAIVDDVTERELSAALVRIGCAG
ncbi:MAG TPA: 3-dehydroquinate synthase [Vicinamibacterales bacterium]|nr:3-dehydroquinate synthase [Vicinamibacterales bacterium]